MVRKTVPLTIQDDDGGKTEIGYAEIEETPGGVKINGYIKSIEYAEQLNPKYAGKFDYSIGMPIDLKPDRTPFLPPYTYLDVPRLDKLHDYIDLGDEWRASDVRADLLNPKYKE